MRQGTIEGTEDNERDDVNDELDAILKEDDEIEKFEETDYFMIDVDRITIPETLLRLVPDVEIDELMASIKNDGLLQPIIISKDGELVAGYRRLMACKKLNFDQIKANVMGLPKEDRYRIGLIENLQRKQLSIEEEGKSYGKLLADKARFPSQRALAKALGVSEGKVSGALNAIGKAKKQSAAVREKRAVQKVKVKTRRIDEKNLPSGVTALISRDEVNIAFKIKIRDKKHADSFDIKQEVVAAMEEVSSRVFRTEMDIARSLC